MGISRKNISRISTRHLRIDGCKREGTNAGFNDLDDFLTTERRDIFFMKERKVVIGGPGWLRTSQVF
jgi:hypothetical protein